MVFLATLLRRFIDKHFVFSIKIFKCISSIVEILFTCKIYFLVLFWTTSFSHPPLWKVLGSYWPARQWLTVISYRSERGEFMALILIRTHKMAIIRVPGFSWPKKYFLRGTQFWHGKWWKTNLCLNVTKKPFQRQAVTTSKYRFIYPTTWT